MCGIAGVFSKNPLNLNNTIKNMVKSVSHRGPDAFGYHIKDDYALGHARLSIIDLNERSNQPLYDESGRYFIIFNGEIYNFLDIKSKIGNKYKFLTSSDTEVLLAAYIIFGKNMLEILNGCFSFAIYDKEKKILFFARDRLGIKPLYYYYDEHFFIISSEIRQILFSGLIKKELDYNGINHIIQYQSTKAPTTIIKNINMLRPGSFGQFSSYDFKLKINKYWNPKIKLNDTKQDYLKTVQLVKEKVFSSVEKRMIADVEIAAFLSGGVDSSIIVSIMSQISNNRINTFSLVHDNPRFDESLYSDLISKEYRTNHYKVKVSKAEILSDISEALCSFDTPSADGLNSYIVSNKIKKFGIKVALSGLGGDELFSGYPQFKYWYLFNKLNFLIPKKILVSLLSRLHLSNKYFSKLFKIITNKSTSYNVNNIFRNVLGQNTNLTLNNHIHSSEYNFDYNEPAINNYLISQYSITELLGYTSNVLLKDADQTSMANSLEIRVPFMDHELIEYVLSLKDNVKKPMYSKKLLIDAFKENLPKKIYNRKKQGFIIPTNLWMRNELLSLSRSSIEILCDSNYFNKDNINQAWNNYINNNENGTLIWSLVVLGNWIDNNKILS